MFFIRNVWPCSEQRKQQALTPLFKKMLVFAGQGHDISNSLLFKENSVYPTVDIEKVKPAVERTDANVRMQKTVL